MSVRLKISVMMLIIFGFGVGAILPQSSLAATKTKSTVQKTRPVAAKKKKVIAAKAATKPTRLAKSTKTASKARSAVKKPAAKSARRTNSKQVTASLRREREQAKNFDRWVEADRLFVQSSSAIVVDQQAGNTLYKKNDLTVAPIASITKLMTAMVVLDSAPNLAESIAISDEDVDYLRGSRSRLPVGTRMPRETALLLALMSSENRAAHALSRHYPGGGTAFIQAMNAKARELGMRHTRFEDPTGLSSRNVSTAQDLVKMVSAAHTYPLIREFSTTSEASVNLGAQDLAFRNTNPLVKSSTWDVGLSKTGFIHEAGKCLVMQARVADKPVVIVLLDAAGKLSRVGDANRIKRWMEHSQLTLSRNTPKQSVLLAGTRTGLSQP